MRIHTSLTHDEMSAMPRLSGAPISFHALTECGSRTHARAFEVRLTGTGGRSNTGLYGSGDFDGATWDEWGAFFGALFDADPAARCGGSSRRPVYGDADHFHFLTGDRFHKRVITERHPSGSIATTRTSYLPADTHPRHRWVYQGSWGDHGSKGHVCGKDGCTATQPGHVADQEYRYDNAIGA